MPNKINWSLTLLGGRQAARRPGGEGFKSCLLRFAQIASIPRKRLIASQGS